MPQVFNQERAAKALIDAILMGDRAAAEKYDVTIKSIEGWRVRLETDEKFREFFLKLKRQKDQEWASEIPAALSGCISFVLGASQHGDRTDPDMVMAINKTIETLSDVALTWKVIDERLRADRGETEET